MMMILMVVLIMVIMIYDYYDDFYLYISEEGEKTENESGGGVYQLRSLSS